MAKEITLSTQQKTKNFLLAHKLLLFIVAIILAIGGYFVITKNKSKSPQYQTATVQKGTIVQTVSASGQVNSTNMVSITSSATGVVSDVFVRNGEQVSAGENIAQITLDSASQAKNAQNWSQYLQAKTNLDSANSTAFSLRSAKDTAWKKYYDLATSAAYQNADGSPRDDIRNSSAVFQSAQGDWLAAEAKYKDQQAVIGQTQAAVFSSWLSYNQSAPTITAPISGTIQNLTIVPGMVISQQSSTTNNANQRMAVIENSGMPLASVNLAEVDAPKVQQDQKATITVDALSGKSFTGRVVTIDHIGSISNNVTNYPAIIQFDTRQNDLLPNMAATANIIVDTKDDVLEVPSAAIQNQGGQTTVRVLKNGQVNQVPVEVGISSDTQTEITSGLSEGDVVVTGTVSTSTGQSQNQGGSPFGIRTGGFGGGAFRGGGGGGR